MKKSLIIIILGLMAILPTSYASTIDGQGRNIIESDEFIMIDDYYDAYGAYFGHPTETELVQIKSSFQKNKNKETIIDRTTGKPSGENEDSKTAHKEIEEYNAKIECLMNEKTDNECAKFVRRVPMVQKKASSLHAASK